MSLGFVLGDATKNHRQVLLEQITNWQAEDPQARFSKRQVCKYSFLSCKSW